jgi:hypothetical protein
MYFKEKAGMQHPRVSQIHTSTRHHCIWSIPSLEYPGMVKVRGYHLKFIGSKPDVTANFHLIYVSRSSGLTTGQK